MRIKLYDKNGKSEIFTTESNIFLSALKEIYFHCNNEYQERFFKLVTSEELEMNSDDDLNSAKNFFKVESINDLDLFSTIIFGIIACKAKIIPETTEREANIAINAILDIRVYKKLEAENKVYSEDNVDIAQLTRDCADIAIKYVDTYGEEYGWTDFIESKLLELYGIK